MFITERMLQTTIAIIGSHSAAQEALDQMKILKSLGKDPICIKTDHTLFVMDRNTYQKKAK